VTNDMVRSWSISAPGAAANGTHVTTYRDDLIQQGLSGALADPDNTAISVPIAQHALQLCRVPGSRTGLQWAVQLRDLDQAGDEVLQYPFGMVNWASHAPVGVMASDWDNWSRARLGSGFTQLGHDQQHVACPCD